MCALWGTEAGVAAAARLLAAKPESSEVLWAGTYIYCGAGADPAPLLPLITDKDPAIRLMAAAGLVERGDKRGFAPLIDLLAEPGLLALSHPPRSLWSAATHALVRATGMAELGPPFDADDAMVAAAHKRWLSWLQANDAKLKFAPEQGEWEVN
ncbi:MAG TPA: HEAT repeat domain-containing protein [Pyrinomonadaceae bacterium]